MFPILFLVLGLCIGSFIPCFAERRQYGLSQSGRSRCLSCGATLSPLELVPVFGYVLCKGRCRHCSTAILKRYPVIELASGIVGLIIGLSTNNILHGSLLLGEAAALLLLSLDDIESLYIRDRDLLFLALLFAIDAACFGTIFWLNRLIGAIVIALPLFILQRLMPHGLGSGDIIFISISGLYLGIPIICYAFLIGTLAALAYCISLALSARFTKQSPIPLVPFLSFGVLTTILVYVL